MPLSIASAASGGGASAAAVANSSATNISATRPAVRLQQRREAAQLAPAPGGRPPAPHEVVAARERGGGCAGAAARSSLRPLTARHFSIGSRLRKTWSGRPLVAISAYSVGLARGARRECPRATMRPCSSTTMSSASAIVESRWAMTNVVRPCMTSRRAALISRSVVASTEEVASSRIRTRGSARKARAIAIRWRWPPLRGQAALADAGVVAVGQLGDELRRPGRARRPARSPRARRPGARRRCCPRPCPRTGTGRRRRPRSRAAARRRRRRGRRRRRSAPAPERGSYRRGSSCTSVVLPEPGRAHQRHGRARLDDEIDVRSASGPSP